MQKYSLLNAASEKHIKRLEDAFGSRQSLIGSLFGTPTPNYLMKKLPSLFSADGCREYEFLIEYDIFNPSQGIYFGCKSLTLPDHRHSVHIQKASEDWNRVKPHLIRRLNNTFPDIDFSCRFLDTDNFNNNTFWPFWISVYPNEDLKNTIFPALEIIRNTYADMLEGRLQEELYPKRKKTKGRKMAEVISFTNSSMEKLLTAITNNIRSSYAGHDFENISKEGLSLFNRFLTKAVELGYFFKHPNYECAYILTADFSDIDFHCMLKHLFSEMEHKLKITKIKIPWSAFLKVFLNSDGTTFKPQIRTLVPSLRKETHWKSTLPKLLK